MYKSSFLYIFIGKDREKYGRQKIQNRIRAGRV